ncbi:hypothetical protein ACOME3_009919 [Neoechinorhynchus agilis]
MNVPIHHHHHQAVMTNTARGVGGQPIPEEDEIAVCESVHQHHLVTERSEHTVQHEETFSSRDFVFDQHPQHQPEDDEESQTNLLHTLTNIYNFPGCFDEERSSSSNYNIQSIVEIHDGSMEQQDHQSVTKDASSCNTRNIVYTDAKSKFVAWLESIESLLLADSFAVSTLRTMESRKINFDEMYADVMEKTADLEHVKRLSREYAYGGGVVSQEDARNTELELNNLADRLSDAAIFVKDRSQKYSSAIRQLSNHEQDVNNVRLRLNEMDAQLRSISQSQQHKYASTAVIQSQMTAANGLLDDARILQSSIDRISETAAEIARVSTESFASKIKADADSVAQHWSQLVSQTKQSLNQLQSAFAAKRGFEDSALEIEVWLADRSREVLNDDGPIYYPEQIEERLSKYRHLLNELIRKQEVFTTVVASDVDDDHSREMAKLKQSWLTLKSKVENKIRHYEDVERNHNELKVLLNEENEWLSMLQSRTFSSTITATTDPDTISEELNALERLVNERPHVNRQRISELNKTLEAKRVMIPALGNQIRQFEFRWDQLHEDALKRIEVLEDSIRESQRIQKHITELYEWMTQTETLISSGSYSSTKVSSLHEQFGKYERILQNLIDKAALLRSAGKIECARKLEYQLDSLRNRFDDLHNRYRQMQRPTDFEPRLARCRQQLSEVDGKMQDIDIRSDDIEIIQSQLENAGKLYSQLSDLKPEIEQVIKQGRSIVDRRQTDRLDETTHDLDRLKHQFNDLGARVTTGKENLECVLKCLRKFHNELTLVLEWVRKMDNELRKLEGHPVVNVLAGKSAASDEQLEWIRSTRVDIRKLDSNFQILHSLQRDIERRADKPIISLSDRISDAQRKVDQLCKRLKDRSTVLEDQYEQCESDYQRFQSTYQSIQVLIDKTHTDLSSSSTTDINRVADTLHRLRSQIDHLSELGRNLGSRSNHFSELALNDLDNVCRRYDDLKDRYNHFIDKYEYQQQIHHQRTIRKEDRSLTTTDDDEPEHVEPASSQKQPPMANEDDEFRRKYARCLAYLQLIDKLVSRGTLPDDAHADLAYLRDDFSSRHVIDREMIERVIKETERTIHVIEHREPSRAKKLKSMLSRLEDQVRRIELKLDNVCTPTSTTKLDKGVDEGPNATCTTDGYESSDFLYGAAAGDDHRSVISEPSTTRLSRLDKWMQRQSPSAADQFRLQPLLRVRSLRAIGRTGRSYTSSQFTHQNQQQHNQQSLDRRYRRAISSTRPPHPVLYYPAAAAAVPYFPYLAAGARPVMYRERIIDKHTATRHVDSAQRQAEDEFSRSSKSHQPITTSSSTPSQSYRVRQVPVMTTGNNSGGGTIVGTGGASTSRMERSSSASRYYHHHQSSGGGGGASSSFKSQDQRQ